MMLNKNRSIVIRRAAHWAGNATYIGSFIRLRGKSNFINARNKCDTCTTMSPSTSSGAKLVRSTTTFKDVRVNDRTAFLTTAGAFMVALTAAALSIPSKKSMAENSQSHKIDHSKKLDVYIMDRIARKPYLNFNAVPTSPNLSTGSSTARRHYLRGRHDNSQDKNTVVGDTENTTNNQNESEQRPEGVPSRLRILAIDVPEFKDQAFSEGAVCRIPPEIFEGIDGQPNFRDGVAPPKRPRFDDASLDVSDESDVLDGDAKKKKANKRSRASKKPIVQKSLARRLYYCYDPRHSGADSSSHFSQHQEAKNGPNAPSKHSDKNKKSSASSPDTHRRHPSHRNKKSHSIEHQKDQLHHGPPKIGVEVLEASVIELNPSNIRRTYTSANLNSSNHKSGSSWKRSSYSYDPGKYTDRRYSRDSENEGVADVDEAEFEEETLEQGHRDSDNHDLNEDDDEDIDIDLPKQSNSDRIKRRVIRRMEDERDAPWNQYAWLEEMHLRINGVVPFGSPMERAHLLSRRLYGQIYQQIVPISSTSYKWWFWWLWPPFWGSGGSRVGGSRAWEGVDGKGEGALYGEYLDYGNGESVCRTGMKSWFSFWPWSSSTPPCRALNRASNKPHAVIADGAAMQRVPGALRFLIKTCREANVPLYILNDPRSWGSTTHSTLPDALADMRKTIPTNVVRKALELREGSAFERGRLVGRWENEIAWQAWDAGRKTREVWNDAKERWKKEKKEDWSKLSDEELRKKLTERKVITFDEADKEEECQGDKQREKNDDDKLRELMKCSDGFVELCKHCLK